MSDANQESRSAHMGSFFATAFRGTPLGRTVLGSEENCSLSHNDMKNYMQKQDTGGVDHKELFAVISLNFEKLPNSPAGGVEVAMETAVFT
jgi:predicted Zn-dependent peptidase